MKEKETELTKEQLILMDTLVYLGDENEVQGQKISDVVDRLLEDNGKELDKNRRKDTGKYPGQLSREEWIHTLNLIKQDKTLMSMEIVDIEEDKSTGFKAMTIAKNQNDKKGASVIFRGTTGDVEWVDNAEGGYQEQTRLQKKALDYINRLGGMGYSDVTTSGHSKEAN